VCVCVCVCVLNCFMYLLFHWSVSSCSWKGQRFSKFLSLLQSRFVFSSTFRTQCTTKQMVMI